MRLLELVVYAVVGIAGFVLGRRFLIMQKQFSTSDRTHVGCVEINDQNAKVGIADHAGNILWCSPLIIADQRETNDVLNDCEQQLLRGICIVMNMMHEEDVIGEYNQHVMETARHGLSRIGVACGQPDMGKGGVLRESGEARRQAEALVAAFQKRFPESRIVVDTDVNVSAFSEYLHLCRERPCVPHVVAYITVGASVAVGLVDRGRPYRGLLHSELGHMCVKRHADDMDFRGKCELHSDCLEGLITAEALAARLGISLTELPGVPSDQPVWKVFSFYLGQFAAAAASAYGADYVIVGGGVCRGAGEGRGFLVDDASMELGRAITGHTRRPVIRLARSLRDVALSGVAVFAVHEGRLGR